VLNGLSWLLQILAGRAMDQEHPRNTASRTLANQTTIEPHMIGRPHSNAEYGRLAINGNASSANPILDLTARR
jgi:hypothetical protein